MKFKLIDWLVILIIVGVGVMVYRTPLYKNQVVKLISRSACDTPLTFKVGKIDPKFELTNYKTNTAINSAAEIWNQAYGKKILSEQTNAKLTINFVYDERTALNSEINQMEGSLNTSSADIKARLREYDSDVKTFRQKLADFNSKVASYNRQGGVSREIYNQLVNEQKQLQTDGDALNARAKQLNLAANSYNANLGTLNKNIDQFNQVISKKPEEGLYNSADNTITIYFAGEEKELIHTLAHEFGHYLGIDHVSDPTAIMYTYTSTSTSLAADDQQQLDWVCREQPIPVFWLNSVREYLVSLKQKTS